MALKFIQTFEVTGASEFPHDMLREDACFPIDVQDHDKLAARSIGQCRTVKLGRHIHKVEDLPTVDRWKTAGWPINEDKIVTEHIPKE